MPYSRAKDLTVAQMTLEGYISFYFRRNLSLLDTWLYHVVKFLHRKIRKRLRKSWQRPKKAWKYGQNQLGKKHAKLGRAAPYGLTELFPSLSQLLSILPELGPTSKHYREASFNSAPKETFPNSCPNVKTSV